MLRAGPKDKAGKNGSARLAIMPAPHPPASSNPAPTDIAPAGPAHPPSPTKALSASTSASTSVGTAPIAVLPTTLRATPTAQAAASELGSATAAQSASQTPAPAPQTDVLVSPPSEFVAGAPNALGLTTVREFEQAPVPPASAAASSAEREYAADPHNSAGTSTSAPATAPKQWKNVANPKTAE